MRRPTKSLIAALVFSWCAVSAQVSPAEEIGPALAGGQMDALDESGIGQAMPNESLGEMTGRQETFINNLEAQVTNSDQHGQANANTITAAVTNGANSISGNAFAGASGLVTVIQNSGNQVLIQNDLIMNLTVK